MDFSLPRLYAIVDAAQLASRSPAEVTNSLLAAGVRLIQYRAKQSNAREIYTAVLTLARRVQLAGGVLIVNDRADVALAAGANGVHVGQEDLPALMERRLLTSKMIGLSTHSIEQVKQANLEPVDYVAFGPIFATDNKEKPDPVVGLSGLAKAREATQKPLVAIGGITLENARSVLDAGADSVAVISALLSAPDVGEQARRFLAALGD